MGTYNEQLNTLEQQIKRISGLAGIESVLQGLKEISGHGITLSLYGHAGGSATLLLEDNPFTERILKLLQQHAEDMLWAAEKTFSPSATCAPEQAVATAQELNPQVAEATPTQAAVMPTYQTAAEAYRAAAHILATEGENDVTEAKLTLINRQAAILVLAEAAHRGDTTLFIGRVR